MTAQDANRQQPKTGRSPKGKPRKRAAPVWRRWWFRVPIVSLALVLIGGTGWWSLRSGTLDRIMSVTKWQVISTSAHIGLRIDKVLVAGRRETGRDDLLQALGTVRGTPILAFDAEQARQRVARLPWVRRAAVERMLPDTILLTVEERAPLAVWQHKGTLALIDYEGEVIQRDQLERFRHLMLVVGEDAPRHTASLLETLGSQPALMSLVRAAVRVGARRWNLRLDGGIDVQLPEENAALAWQRLAQYQRSHNVLQHDVKTVDLRLPDRLIVRKAPVIDGVAVGTGQET